MLRYIARRLGYMIITLVLVSIVGFAIIELPPGSYLDSELMRLQQQGGDITEDVIRALEIRFGVNDPPTVKYWKWVTGFVRGDFGYSFQYRLPVRELVGARLAYTVLITTLTLLFNWVVAIIVGVHSATHQKTISDYGITVLQFVGLSVPSFLFALVLMYVAYKHFGLDVSGLYSPIYRDAPWSSAKFLDLIKHLWLPVLVIGASGTAWLSRVMRANLLDVLNMQYVQTARAKGVPESKVIWKHAVRNALHPLVMVLGMALPEIISGSTVVSMVLNMPTTGPLYFNALLNKDMYLASTFLMFLAFLLLLGNLLADVLLAWVDPRIRLQ